MMMKREDEQGFDVERELEDGKYKDEGQTRFADELIRRGTQISDTDVSK